MPRLVPTSVVTGTNHAAVKRFRGYTITSGAAAVELRFRDGSLTGQILWRMTGLSNATRDEMFPAPFDSPNGVYVELISGTFTEGQLASGT